MTARSTGHPRASQRPRGGPLVMLAVLLVGWSAARIAWWEDPFAPIANALDLPQASLSASASADVAALLALPALPAVDPPRAASVSSAGLRLPLRLMGLVWRGDQRSQPGRDPRFAAAHHLMWYTALRQPVIGAPLVVSAHPDQGGEGARWSLPPPFLAQPAGGSGLGLATAPLPASAPARTAGGGGRWSLDAWAFWRQGSTAAPVSQGRVPIYGASQTGAVLQYRAMPDSLHDPRLYARAYRALVRRGENELALGGSARPIGRVPLRAAGEVRYTDGAFSNGFRPAAYVVSELAPVALAYGARLEAYGQAGWVGGRDPTGFADGQASVTGELRTIAGLTDDALHLSVGAAAWGGAQKDAQRIDIGPTVRLDLTLGEVPARLTVDWRERVGGDAGPGSGLAATLSTRF